jgi:hypothetical protein
MLITVGGAQTMVCAEPAVIYNELVAALQGLNVCAPTSYY